MNYLAERGITPETCRAHGIEVVVNPIAKLFKDRLGFDSWNGKPLQELATQTIWVPCYDASGNRKSWIARVLPELEGAKFLTPRGADPFPFIPPQTWEVKDKPHKTIIITEGPVKALAILQSGGIPIGVGGVWMATTKTDNQGSELAPALREFKCLGRLVYLAFDADYLTNPSVRQAVLRTALCLFRHGAIAKCLRWELKEGKGIDDYLVTKAKAGIDQKAVIDELSTTAVSISQLVGPEDLVVVEAELKLVGLSKAQLSQQSRLLGASLKVRAGALEESITEDATERSTREFSLRDPEPWPEPVNAVELVNEIITVVQRHVIVSEPAATMGDISYNPGTLSGCSCARRYDKSELPQPTQIFSARVEHSAKLKALLSILISVWNAIKTPARVLLSFTRTVVSAFRISDQLY